MQCIFLGRHLLAIHRITLNLEDPTHTIHGTNGVFTYIWLFFMVNVGKYTIHGCYGHISTLSKTARTWKRMVGRRSGFIFGAEKAYFQRQNSQFHRGEHLCISKSDFQIRCFFSQSIRPHRYTNLFFGVFRFLSARMSHYIVIHSFVVCSFYQACHFLVGPPPKLGKKACPKTLQYNCCFLEQNDKKPRPERCVRDAYYAPLTLETSHTHSSNPIRQGTSELRVSKWHGTSWAKSWICSILSFGELGRILAVLLHIFSQKSEVH